MLAAAFASWIERIPERAFDAAFLDLLRAQGFYDIHFTHGPYEFGKDFIAKRDEPNPVQFAFQGKAGDIGGPEWNGLYSQLLELASDGPAHPCFDRKLPRKSVLVLTGRLIGKATVGPSQLKAHLQKADLGEFDPWDIDTLKELLAGSTARFPVAPTTALLPVLGHVEADIPTERMLERELAGLIPPASAPLSHVHRAIVDNSLVVARLVDKEHPFLALHAALNAVRIGVVRAHSSPADGRGLVRDALDSYVALGKSSLAPLLDAPSDPDAWIKWVGGPSLIGTYPVACSKTLEFVGLAALHEKNQERDSAARSLAEIAARIVDGQPGSAHPISDRCAAGYAPVLAVLAQFGWREQAARLVRQTTKWLCDRYEASSFGLAGAYADPTDEVRTLLGAPFEFIDLEKRRDSLLAVALADASYALSLPDYSSVVNDLLAVGVTPSALHPLDEAEAYVIGRGGTSALVNIRYPEAQGAELLPHHALQKTPRVPEQVGGPAACFALACLARDRLFTDVLTRVGNA